MDESAGQSGQVSAELLDEPLFMLQISQRDPPSSSFCQRLPSHTTHLLHPRYPGWASRFLGLCSAVASPAHPAGPVLSSESVLLKGEVSQPGDHTPSTEGRRGVAVGGKYEEIGMTSMAGMGRGW